MRSTNLMNATRTVIEDIVLFKISSDYLTSNFVLSSIVSFYLPTKFSTCIMLCVKI